VLRALLLAVVVALVVAPTAVAATQTASSGAVAATLATTDAGASTVTVTRDGLPAYEAPVGLRECREGGCTAPDGALQVRDLDADGDPEVLVTLYTGGAHCCSVTRILRWDGARYLTIDRNFGNSGFRAQAGPGGTVDLRTTDDRFAYLYGSYAASVRPVQVFALQDGRLVDVTRLRPDLVRADARRNLKLARRTRLRTAWAAWAADQYLLDRRSHALRSLRGHAARGDLRTDLGNSSRSGQRRFVQRLDRDLRRFGYAG
jgi:hypothetical protein